MRKFFSNLSTFILSVIIVLIFGGTVYFALDLLGIIEVPEEYSLASLFTSEIEVLSTSDFSEQSIIPNAEEFNEIVQDTIVVDVSDGNEITVTEEVREPVVESAYSSTETVYTTNNATEENTYSDYSSYYNQLDSYAKTIYNKVLENEVNLRTGTYTIEFGKTFDDLLHTDEGTEVLNNSFQLAMNGLVFDHPEIFYIDITKMYLLTQITTRAFSKTYEVSIGANGGNYLYDDFLNSDIDECVAQIENIKNSFINSASNSSDYLKIKQVHDYIIDNTEYNSTFSGTNIYGAYGTLVCKSSVCEGYSKAFKYLLNALDVPCIVVCGIGRNSSGVTESHAWNYVYLENAWYAVDVTWDDPIIIGNGIVTDDIKYNYFLKGGNSFYEDHVEDGKIVTNANFLYPTLSVLNY